MRRAALRWPTQGIVDGAYQPPHFGWRRELSDEPKRLLSEGESREHATRIAVCLGGDTDTLACIAGAAAEAIHGLPADIAATARSYLTPDLRSVMDRFDAAVFDRSK